MGSWNETCILTNLPIVGHEDVVALQSENLDRLIYLFDSPFFENINIAVGKSDYYGNIDSITEKFSPDNYSFRFDEIDDEKILSFCYRDIWDKIVEKSKNNTVTQEWWEKTKKTFLICNRIKDGDSWKLLEEFYYVARFLGKARAGFPENLQRGSQSIDTNARRFIAQLTLEKADWIDNYLEEN